MKFGGEGGEGVVSGGFTTQITVEYVDTLSGRGESRLKRGESYKRAEAYKPS